MSEPKHTETEWLRDLYERHSAHLYCYGLSVTETAGALGPADMS
ncbi:MAG TPA: hypothetical protein VG317_11520 [Pseudonocardiaceae bacterium]|jgi:hypothetical protein|nr:hypothetical protein [Pseudonocardiaceae bacterium]